MLGYPRVDGGRGWKGDLFATDDIVSQGGFARNMNELRTFTDPALVVDGTVDNRARWLVCNDDPTICRAIVGLMQNRMTIREAGQMFRAFYQPRR